MGIPSYFSYIIKNHPTTIKKHGVIKNISNFYLDSNSIIYDALQNIEFKENVTKYENELIAYVIKKIQELIKTIKPSKKVLIAFDGVAPIAKLQQQKTRRYKSMYINKIIDKLEINTDNKWDKTAITPGTKFMAKLGLKIAKKFSTNKRIIVSATDEEGEGEHKIFNFIRTNPEKHLTETTIIYGLDADLIMLCLNNMDVCPNIYIYRETPEFIKSLDNNFEPNVLYCMDIKEFSNAIVKEIGGNENNKNSIISDYIFICFFLGNDFMPHFPSLNIRTNGINLLMTAYHNTISFQKKNLLHNGEICWKNLKEMIIWLVDNEEENLLKEYRIREKWSNKFYNCSTKEEILKKIDNIPTQIRTNEQFIDPHNEGWEQRYYINLFDTEPSDKFINKLSTNYLEGLEWVYKYYTKGCPDWNWKYNYHYPPLLSDLVNFIPHWNTTMIEPNNNKSIPPIVQLSYVIPKDSFNLLPKNIGKILFEKYDDFYPEDPKIHWAFCKYFWEAHIDFIDIDIDNFIRDLNC